MSEFFVEDKTQKSPLFYNLKAERDHFWIKLREIDTLVELSTDTEIEILKQKIREILYCTPQQVPSVLDNG